ncbi:MAG: hypothetical protein JWM76_1277 [Pseudonocardiales bacterium]|nr:hypothetical protein [Pseudonocardiales bacterium]
MRLKPRSDQFYVLFEDAGRTLVMAANVLAELRTLDVDRHSIAVQMRDLEHRADGHTHTIMRELNERFVTPFDREDIHELASRVDDVVDLMDEAADFLSLAHMGELPPEVIVQLELVKSGAHVAGKGLELLRTPQALEPTWIELNRLENEADDVYRALLSRLYVGGHDPMDVMKTRELCGLLEDCADALEHVAHTFETIAVKQR